MVRSVLLAIALVLASSATARAEGEIYTLAGSGEFVNAREGMPAIRAGLLTFPRIAALPDGGFLVGDFLQVWRVDPQGSMHLAAGTAEPGVSGDGGPAVKARVWVDDLETLPGGGFLIADSEHGLIRMVDPAGVITTVARGRATSLAALPGGGFVFGDDRTHVREVGPDGRIHTIGGDGGSDPGHPAPHGEPATSQPIDVGDVAVAEDGGVLVADDIDGRIDRIAQDGALTVALDPPGDERPNRLAPLPGGGLLYTAGDRLWRMDAGGAVAAIAGSGPFIRTAFEGLQQRLSGQSAQRADLHFLSDVDALPDGGALISYGADDDLSEGGFVGYVVPATPGLLGAAILRDRDRVFTPGALHAVTISLTEAATVTLTAGGGSITRELPAGTSRVVTPPLERDRPQRIELTATAGARRAFDAVRTFPPGWLPAETAARVAGIIASDVDHCHRFGANRVDCLTNKGDFNCHSVTVRLTRDRLRWAEYGPCAIRSHPRLARALRPLTRANSGCQDCSSRLFGRIDEAALVPAT